MRTITAHKVRGFISNTICHVVLAVLSVIWLLPIAWLVMHSFRADPGAFPRYIVPRNWTIQNYVLLFTDTSVFNFPLWFRNTLKVAIFTCAISTMINLMTSFALSRLRFKGRRPLMNMLLIIGMFPGIMSMLAVFHILNLVNLTQSLVGLTIVYTAGASMGFLITKGFFDMIPHSIDEAAILDGASKNMLFWKITLPLSRPIITYTMIITFMGPWLDFMFAAILMRGDQSRFTVAVGLRMMIERETIGAFFTRFCAASVVVSIPLIVLFLFTQKNFVEGVTSGAAKG